MAEARKQPRQNEFDRVSFSQPPPRQAQEVVPQRPIDSLIPDVVGEQAKKVEVVPPSPPPVAAPKPPKSPAPRPKQKPAEQEPPKGKITVMLPEEVIERLRNVAYWGRSTLAELAEEGVLHVLAKRERENGGPFEAREGQLRTGRPPREKAPTRKT